MSPAPARGTRTIRMCSFDARRGKPKLTPMQMKRSHLSFAHEDRSMKFSKSNPRQPTPTQNHRRRIRHVWCSLRRFIALPGRTVVANAPVKKSSNLPGSK